MARKARRVRRRRTPRRTRRRYSLRRRVAGLSRRMAAEVKKNDNAQLITAENFEQLTGQNLYDYAYLYPIFDATMQQGTQLNDIIGEQIRIKYIYLGLHLQQGAASTVSQNALPVCLRVLLVQDRNYRSYNAGVPTAAQMFSNLFGYQVSADNPYQGQIDCTLLPYTPLEPGRFRIVRDFQMKTAPGWKSDYYRKFTVLQKHLNSKGRVYFGPAYPQPVGVVYSSTYNPSGYRVVWQTGSANHPSDVEGEQLQISSPIWSWIVGGPVGTQENYFASSQVYSNEAAALTAYKQYMEAQPTAAEATDTNISYTTSRNGLYLLILRQGSPTTPQTQPSFALSLQSRLAYYDN